MRSFHIFYWLSADSPLWISLIRITSNNYVMLQLWSEYHNFLVKLARFHIVSRRQVAGQKVAYHRCLKEVVLDRKLETAKCIISAVELAIALYRLVRLTDNSTFQNLGFDFCENLADKFCQIPSYFWWFTPGEFLVNLLQLCMLLTKQPALPTGKW